MSEATQMDTCDIEMAVVRHLGTQRHVIVPNVYSGIGLLYEADLVALRRSNYAVEIEIKTSAADIKADLGKRKWLYGKWPKNRFCEFWFAVPESLSLHPLIPEHAGVYSVSQNEGGNHVVRVAKKPERNRKARRFTLEERQQLIYLGFRRLWDLKAAVNRWKNLYEGAKTSQ